jgi:hypothetical protein
MGIILYVYLPPPFITPSLYTYIRLI